MDEQFHTNEYRTGCTNPQKSHGGLIAVLLIFVIFLGGIVSVLSFMNIRLFHYLELSATHDTPLSFSQGEAGLSEGSKADQKISLVLEGMTLQELSAPYRELYNLPEGLYVAQIAEGSHADTLKLLPGDVLISFAGTPVARLQTLLDLYTTHRSGAQVELVIYRSGRKSTLTLTLEQEE